MGPRKVFSRTPLIEEYRYVPYDEVCPVKASQMESLDQYLRQCYGQAFNLIGKFNLSAEELTTFDDSVKSIIRAQVEVEQSSQLSGNESIGSLEDKPLLKLLMDLNSIENNTIDEKSVEQFKEMILSLDSDLLNKSFEREDLFRPLLETVVENNGNNNRINVLEVTQSESIIAQTAIQLIQLSTFDMKVNYCLLHPMVSKLSADSINGLECHQWLVEKSRLPSELNNYDLILYEDRFDLISSEFNVNLSQLFESLWSSLKDNGFLIVVHKIGLNFAEEVLAKISVESQNCNNNQKNCITNEDLIQRRDQILIEAEKVGFSLICTKIDGFSAKSSLVLRKLSTDIRLERQTFIHVTNDKCEHWLEKLQNSLKTIEDRPESEYIWLLGDDSPNNGVIGLVNCLRKEPNGHRIRCIFRLDAKNNQNITENPELLASIVKKNLIFNVLTADGRRGSFKHMSIDVNENQVPSEHCYLNVQTKGDLSSFKWFEAQHKYWPLGKGDNQELIDVYYAPLNFRDIMLATGESFQIDLACFYYCSVRINQGKLAADALPDDMGLQDCILGLEFSGRDSNGNRVMGMTPSKGLATTVVMEDLDFVWPIPDYWSMEEASTVPVVYATAYYALIIRGKLSPKESVLIHSGSGGVGQAAIAICLAMDCQLFITCGSDSKREFLKEEFSPKLSDKNFWTSRDSSFESFVLRETAGRGVDLILNSLAEDKLQASVRCLATSGRFLEIGKYDLSQNNELGNFF